MLIKSGFEGLKKKQFHKDLEKNELNQFCLTNVEITLHY